MAVQAVRTSAGGMRRSRLRFLLFQSFMVFRTTHRWVLPSPQDVPRKAARRRDGPAGRLYNFAASGQVSNLISSNAFVMFVRRHRPHTGPGLYNRVSPPNRDSKQVL